MLEVRHRLLDGRHLIVDGIAQLGAALEAQAEQVGAQLQVVDLDAVHLVHVQVVAVRVERVGIVGLAQEASAAAFADDVGFLQADAAA